jgi:hypothetical protein
MRNNILKFTIEVANPKILFFYKLSQIVKLIDHPYVKFNMEYTLNNKKKEFNDPDEILKKINSEMVIEYNEEFKEFKDLFEKSLKKN